MTLEIRPDDPSSPAVRALVTAHLAGCSRTRPPESVHALDVDGLAADGIRMWSAWIDGDLAGIGACKDLGADRAELKSMRVVDAFLGRGVGRGDPPPHRRRCARAGIESLWLETGSTDDFVPAAGST